MKYSNLILLIISCLLSIGSLQAKVDISNDPLVIVTNSDSQLNELTHDQLIGIYMGRYRSSDESTPILPIDNEIYIETFYKQIINKTVPQVNSYWARLKFTGRDYKRPEKLESSEVVITSLISSTDRISYIPLSQVTDDVKVIYEITQ